MRSGKSKLPPRKAPAPATRVDEIEELHEREGPDREHVVHPVRITQDEAQQLPPARDPDEPLAP